MSDAFWQADGCDGTERESILSNLLKGAREPSFSVISRSLNALETGAHIESIATDSCDGGRKGHAFKVVVVVVVVSIVFPTCVLIWVRSVVVVVV